MTRDIPTLFKMYSPASSARRAVMGWGPGLDLVPHHKCQQCGSKWSRYSPHGLVTIKGPSPWPHFIPTSSANPSYFVTGEVVEAFTAAGLTGFRAELVVPDGLSTKLLYVPPSIYFLQIFGEVRYHPEIYANRPMEICPDCGSRRAHRPGGFYADRLDLSRWEGEDFVIPAPAGSASRVIYCSRRVLELARERKWKNVYFQPAGMILGHSQHWKGLNHLAKKWPPDRWYPPSPTEIRPLEAWLDIALGDEPIEAAKAWMVVPHFRTDAVPRLTELLNDPRDKIRKRAAVALLQIDAYDPIDESLKHKSAPYLSDPVAERWLREP